MNSSRYRVQQWATFGRTWWLYDGAFQCPFQSAEKIIPILEGRHKPIFHPLSNVGDHVVVMNTQHIAMVGERWRTFMYHKSTGFPKKWGGVSSRRAWQLHKIDPTEVFRKAVYARVKGNLLRKTTMARLHLFPEEVPEEIMGNISAQLRQVLPVPKRLDEYTNEELESYPKLFEWPDNHVMNLGQMKRPMTIKEISESEEKQ